MFCENEVRASWRQPHHVAAIDKGLKTARAAAKYMTEGHVECPIVQSRRRVDGQVVVERGANIVKPDAWPETGFEEMSIEL
jgi:hypothetical protein